MSKVVIKDFLCGPFSIGEIKYTGGVVEKILPNDLVDQTCKVLERNVPKVLYGVVEFNSRLNQGFNKRGVPLYLLWPLNPAYPPFLISSKICYETHMLVSFQYEHWEDKWPRGSIIKIYGPVGNTTIESELLFHTYCGSSNEVLFSDETFKKNTHLELIWDEAFNIDPIGCEDKDDIFAWRRVGTKTYFMIAVMSFFVHCTETLKTRSQTF